MDWPDNDNNNTLIDFHAEFKNRRAEIDIAISGEDKKNTENSCEQAQKVFISLGHCSQFHQHFRAAFAPIFFRQSNQSQTVIREKLHKALLYKKGMQIPKVQKRLTTWLSILHFQDLCA